MNKRAIISIIIPVTRINLLDNCINSLASSNLSDCELVFFFNFIKKNRNIEKKIKKKLKKNCLILKIIFNKKFLQIRESWQKALTHHTGKWVMYLCEDDMLYPESIINIKKIILQFSSDYDCFFWNINSFVYNHDTKILREKKNKDLSKKIIFYKSKELLFKILKKYSIHEYKNKIPFFPACIVKSKIVKKKNFYFFEEPMWSSAFSILSITKNYLKVNFPVTIVGEGLDSSSNRHNFLYKKENKNKKDFNKNFQLKFKFINIFFRDFDSSMFIKFNRFIALEAILNFKNSNKKFKNTKFLFNKKKFIKSLIYECIDRNIVGTFFSYFYECYYLIKKYKYFGFVGIFFKKLIIQRIKKNLFQTYFLNKDYYFYNNENLISILNNVKKNNV